MHSQRSIRCSFLFFFDEENVKQLNLGTIKSEIEQAVGVLTPSMFNADPQT